MSERLILSQFAGRTDEVFRVRLPDDAGVLDMHLVRADALPSQEGPGREDPFVLEFRGPSTPALQQGTWRFEHENLDAMDIFVVPVGPDEDGLCYEAVFN